MTSLPITFQVGEKQFTDNISTNDIVPVTHINIDNDYKIYYSNDLAFANMVFKKNTNLTLSVLASLSNKKLETLEDYKFAVQCYLTTFSKMILKKIPIEWSEFKNYISCQIPFENNLIDVNIIVKEEVKPDEEFEFAPKKFININNSEPNEIWNNTLNELTSLDLNFVGKI